MKLNKNIIGLILGPILFSVIMIFVDAEGLSLKQNVFLLQLRGWLFGG